MIRQTNQQISRRATATGKIRPSPGAQQAWDKLRGAGYRLHSSMQPDLGFDLSNKKAGAHQRVVTIQAHRGDRAIAIDRALLAKNVVQIDDPRWLKRPNRFDVRGVDTPGSHRIIPGVAYADKGAKRLARRHHKGWRRLKFT